jgi:hypothetical protein
MKDCTVCIYRQPNFRNGGFCYMFKDYQTKPCHLFDLKPKPKPKANSNDKK